MALSNIQDRRLLYRIATCSSDERLRLEAAHRLNDASLLTYLARNAIHADIRFEAALLVRDEAVLAATALEAWQISQGEMAVIHIDNELILRRIARSANQDAIRLAAALKLNDTNLLHKVAQSSKDIHIRWRVARHLDDPYLLADIACFRPTDSRWYKLRRKARWAFQNHLYRFHAQMDKMTISKIVKSVTHLPLKIDVFLSLPPHKLSQDLLSHMSHLDFGHSSKQTIQQMLDKIKKGGWEVQQSFIQFTCHQCLGAGNYPLKSIAAGSSHLAHDLAVCHGCSGLGQETIKIVTCKHLQSTDVTFHLPA